MKRKKKKTKRKRKKVFFVVRSSWKQKIQSRRPAGLCWVNGMESIWTKKWTSLHDGSINDGLNVVLSVSGVDDALPFGIVFCIILREELKAHV